ncbi:MAG: VIT domain-containing protein [Candidatus Xenobiia bacterium LiM19]
MIEWTEDAEQELQQYLKSLRTVAEYSGRDPEKAEQEARACIEDETGRLGITRVTGDVVKDIIARTAQHGSCKTDSARISSPEKAVKKAPPHPTVKPPGWLHLLFGVALPVASVVVELYTHICGEFFFDPLPDIWYVILFLTIPVFNFILWFIMNGDSIRHPHFLRLINGFSIGISALYALIFLPLLPLALAMTFVGIGFCALSPLTSLISALLLARTLRRKLSDGVLVSSLYTWSGIALSLLCIFALSHDTVKTQIMMRHALSPSESTSVKYVRMLRESGNREVMAKACYAHRSSFSDFFNFILTWKGEAITPEKARELFYRVTGKKYSSADLPESMQERTFRLPPRFSSREEWDGDFTGPRLKGLGLKTSMIDGSLHASAALGYLEWTMVFHNSAYFDEEALAKIVVPPGGVVSRVTLWIDGEEREAAFGSRADTKKAYQEVVSVRKDPLLVTTCGTDKIAIRCFPVPRGGDMKIRIGITFPLMLKNSKMALLRLPYFAERNFNVPDEVKHSVWMESASPLKGAHSSFLNESPEKSLYAVRGLLTDSELSGYEACINAERDPAVTICWSADKVDKKNGFIVQSVVKEKNIPFEHLTLVIDGSLCMKDYIPEICSSVISLPSGMEIQALLASDTGTEGYTKSISMPGTPYLLADSLRKAKYEGGQDNGSVLKSVIEKSIDRPHSAIVWVHGPQPIPVEGTDQIMQAWSRRPGNPLLYSVQVMSGSDPIMDRLSERAEAVNVTRTGPLHKDMADLFSSLDKSYFHLSLRRESAKIIPKGSRGSVEETSSHLTRLWAFDEIRRLMGDGSGRFRGRAVDLAIKYQLVTPVSGAVVLEKKEQYEKAGLKPVDPDTVPTVPEPGIWSLLAVVFIILAVAYIAARKKEAHHV